MLRLAQTRPVETIKIPTRFAALQNQGDGVQARLNSTPERKSHDTGRYLHDGTAVLSARLAVCGERHQWRAANAIPRPGDKQRRRSREAADPNQRVQSPMVVGIGALPVHSAVGCLAWSNGRSFSPQEASFGATPVSHITPRYAPYRIAEIAVGCSNSTSQGCCCSRVTVVARMTLVTKAMSRHRLGTWALLHGPRKRGSRT